MENQNKQPNPEIQNQTPPLSVENEPKRRFGIPKFAFLGIVFVVLLLLLGGVYMLGRSSVLKELNPSSLTIPPKSPDMYQGSPTPDPTADWKTYTNTDLGFSFKYPSESKLTFNCLECEAPDLMISFPNDTYTLISAGSTEKIDKEKPTVKAIIDNKIYVNKFSTYPVTVTRSAYTLDGIEGEKTFSEEKIGNLTRNDIDILVLKDKKLYTFNFRFRPENKQKMSILADQILSTFKFTDSKGGQTVCAQEAKQCPDGSYVSRTGPSCEFTSCPIQ